MNKKASLFEDNNNSIVLRVIHGNNSFLLTGDAEEEEEQSILRSGAEIQSTVLKIAHHGSAYSTSQQWVNVVNPQIAVITCGSDNEYGHPTEQVLSRLKNMGISVLRTDMHGDIIFQEVDGQLRYGVAYDTNENVYTPGRGKMLLPWDTIRAVIVIREMDSSKYYGNR